MTILRCQLIIIQERKYVTDQENSQLNIKWGLHAKDNDCLPKFKI